MRARRKVKRQTKYWGRERTLTRATRQRLCRQEPTQPRKETKRTRADTVASTITGSWKQVHRVLPGVTWNDLPSTSKRSSAKESGSPSGRRDLEVEVTGNKIYLLKPPSTSA